MKDVTVAIVGAGQAGLAASRELMREGIDHVVLERGRVGETWRDRWDSFCLVTPNWSVRLPGHHYDGSDPDGFMARDEIVCVYRALCNSVWSACSRERRGQDDRKGQQDAIHPADFGGRSRRGCRHPRHGRLPAPAPACCRCHPAERPSATRRRRVPQREGATARTRAHRRKWPVGMPDRGGAARGRTRGIRGVRQSAVGSEAPWRPRHCLVVARDRLLRTRR